LNVAHTRFDKKLLGEKKMKGVKRKFEANEISVVNEKKHSLSLISKIEINSTINDKKDPKTNVLNVRKAIRHESRLQKTRGKPSVNGQKKRTKATA